MKKGPAKQTGILISNNFYFSGAITSPSNLLAGRFMTFNILIFSLVFYQFYSASIVSSLLQMPPKTLRTLKQLLDSNLLLAIEKTPYTIDWLTVSIIIIYHVYVSH